MTWRNIITERSYRITTIVYILTFIEWFVKVNITLIINQSVPMGMKHEEPEQENNKEVDTD